MISNVALLSLPLLAAGARHGHHHAHSRAHVARSQAVGNCPTDMVTVTKTAYVTVTVPVAPGVSSAAPSSSSVVQVTSSASPAPSTHPAPSTPAQPPASSTVPQPPAKDKPADNSGTTFNALQAIGNTAIVKNSCTYPVYIWSAGHASCDGVQVQGQLIEPKGTYTETLRRCKDGGMSLKISKTQSAARPLQFEYAIWQDGSENVSYDIVRTNFSTILLLRLYEAKLVTNSAHLVLPRLHEERQGPEGSE